jgi:cytochrome c5
MRKLILNFTNGMSMKSYLGMTVLLVLLCSGCSNTNESAGNAYAVPQSLGPLSEDLQAKYSANCVHCHEQSSMAAPQKGSADWQLILDKPMGETLARVVNGYQGMPPLGQCFDCSGADLETLTLYLAQAVTPSNKEPVEKINTALNAEESVDY